MQVTWSNMYFTTSSCLIQHIQQFMHQVIGDSVRCSSWSWCENFHGYASIYVHTIPGFCFCLFLLTVDEDAKCVTAVTFAGSSRICIIWVQQTRRKAVGEIQQKTQQTAQCQSFEGQSKTQSVVAH